MDVRRAGRTRLWAGRDAASTTTASTGVLLPSGPVCKPGARTTSRAPGREGGRDRHVAAPAPALLGERRELGLAGGRGCAGRFAGARLSLDVVVLAAAQQRGDRRDQAGGRR